MIATPLSDRSYFPALLGNGRSSILIDYTGANFNGRNPHSHTEQNQSVLCGWYKPTHVALTGVNQIQPIIRGGVQVNLYRAPAEPQWYEQELIPQTASVVNRMHYAGGLELEIVNFLTDDEIWCQQITVQYCPEELMADVGFAVSKATQGDLITPMNLPQEADLTVFEKNDMLHRFTYRCGTITGGGMLWTDTPYDVVETDGGLYKNVKTGQRFRRLLCCLDPSDGDNWQSRLDALQQVGTWSYDGLWEANCSAWRERYGDCCLELPDVNIQQLYELSRYVLHTCQHPDFGGITTGTLPYLWGGGIHCPYDSHQGHLALLSSGNIEAGRRYVDYYLRAAEANKKVMVAHGIPGVTISGWDDCKGNALGDFLRYVMEYKPHNGAQVITAIYHQWRFSGKPLTEEELVFIRDVIAYCNASTVHREDGKTYLAPVEAGTEGGFFVTVDTYIQMCIGNAFIQAAEMLGDDNLWQDGEQLLEGLEQNRIDGVLMPFDNAFYTGGISLFACTLDIPHRVIDTYGIDECLRRGKTPWGYNCEQSTEEYRHWPWLETYAAIGYTRRRETEKAMKHLLRMNSVTSSLGALPEKIRLDGYVIGYWYMTPHALVVLALQDAIAHSDRPGELSLLQGITNKWQDLKAANISQPGGFVVSVTVENGVLTLLRVENKQKFTQKLKIHINPMFQGNMTQSEIEIAGEDMFLFCVQ